MHTAAVAAPPQRGADPDKLFRWTLRCLALVAPLLIVALGCQLYRDSQASRQAFGWGFLGGTTWDPVHEHFGAWPFIFGTLFTTVIALVIAAPLGVGVAIFLTEMVPDWLRAPITYLVELLAVVPSVVYGLWGIFVLAPWLQRTVEPWLGATFGDRGLFRGAPYGVGFLAAGLILAVMVTPFVVGLSREAIAAVARPQKEAAFALASTHWEVISKVIVPSAHSGIWGGVLLATGRALGETMAVTMLIGNRPAVSTSLFAPGYTLASVIANEFTEATGKLYPSALVEVGLILFGITLLVNLLARLMMHQLNRMSVAGR